MLYILTALYCEAKPYISAYAMKKVSAPGSMQMFEGDGCRLAISGTGPAASAAAAAHMLTRYAAQRGAPFANIGCAGSKVFNAGETVLCHKLVNAFTGRAFYPEMLYRHPFHEGMLCSAGKAVSSGSAGKAASDSDSATSSSISSSASSAISSSASSAPDPALAAGCDMADMEGAFVYEAARAFLPASQIHCIKVISDRLNPEPATADSIGALMGSAAGAICGWLDGLRDINKPADVFTDEESRLMDCASMHLRLTFAMEQNLARACRMAKKRGLDIAAALSEHPDSPVNLKNEGKAAFAKLMDRLSEGAF